MERLLVIGVLMLAGTVLPFGILNADSQFAAIEDMPYVKAAAYARAVDSYCFPDRKYSSIDLSAMASLQASAMRFVMDGVYQQTARDILAAAEAKADMHLAGDQSACAPAIAFIERAVASIAEIKPDLIDLERKRDAYVQRMRADLEAGRAREAAEHARAACNATLVEVGQLFDRWPNLAAIAWKNRIKSKCELIMPAESAAMASRIDAAIAAADERQACRTTVASIDAEIAAPQAGKPWNEWRTSVLECMPRIGEAATNNVIARIDVGRAAEEAADKARNEAEVPVDGKQTTGSTNAPSVPVPTPRPAIEMDVKPME